MTEDPARGWPPGGVHRVLGPAAPVVAELSDRGWDARVVGASTTDSGLWDGLVEALALPAWFGRNLDALDEVLAGLDHPTALVFAGWAAYATARPERWHRLLDVLEDSARRADPPVVVLLTD